MTLRGVAALLCVACVLAAIECIAWFAALMESEFNPWPVARSNGHLFAWGLFGGIAFLLAAIAIGSKLVEEDQR
jgi:hypothetical protein